MQELLKIHPVTIEKPMIQIDPWDIIKLLGEQQEGVDSHTSSLVEQYIVECLRISSPAGAFVLTESSNATSTEEIIIPGLSFDSGKIVHKMLRHSESYAFFLVTAGPEPENLARSLMMEENYLDGYIVDLVASVLVESVADQVQEQVRILASRQNMKITNRYSPGYCSWDVIEQQKLFSLFPQGSCGISLSESSLMNPVKSVSGIIGIGAKVKYRDYTCEICPMKNCLFRELGDHR